jgi:type IV pilus assembly protein PilB
MTALAVGEEELRALFVTKLEMIDQAEFDKARNMATRLRIPIERALAERGRIPLPFLLEQLADAWGVGFLDLKTGDIQPEALRTVTEKIARRHGLVPFERRDGKLKVAMCNPRDRLAITEVEQVTGLEVLPHLASEGSILRAQLLYRGNHREMLERSVAGVASATARTEDVSGASTASAVDLVTRLLEYAAVSRASDIHIEPYELELLVRYRIDGVLQEALSLPPAAAAPLMSRLKILSGMRIDERRMPQDGRFEADLSGFKVDFRVSSMPTLWGEKIVLRALSKEAAFVDLEDMGLAAPEFETLRKNLLRPFGMILMTGPTGSGKSTSLYAMLMRLGVERSHALNISTIEDPIEYTMSRVNQIPVNVAAGLDFAVGLRALLRQDPDVIMVGELRDRETVEIGVRAALVGRLFLSTLHTNDATSAVVRLVDMGVEPFLIASTLMLVVAQRLARRICVTCRESVALEAGALSVLRARPDFDRLVEALREQGVLGTGADPLAGARLFKGRGCHQCKGSGFRGRVGLFELFEIDGDSRQMIMEGRDGATIRAAAVGKGMKTIFQDGLAKAFLGETSLEEVFRVAL